jgi:hypothetical protein
MVRIFGEHGLIVTDASQIMGDFTGHLEFACYILMEEAILAGDPRINDKSKSRITSSKILINPKGRQARMILNRMAVDLCTNHDKAIPANPGERRWLMMAMSEEHIGDKNYFDAIHNDLANGGDGQFLNFLLRVRLRGFHPRYPSKTLELADQQLMGLKGGSRWLWAGLEGNCILSKGMYGVNGHDWLGKPVAEVDQAEVKAAEAELKKANGAGNPDPKDVGAAEKGAGAD